MSYYIYKYIDDNGAIAYIGKTERLRERIKEHAQEVRFTNLKIIQYAELESKEEMDYLEKYFIDYYKPYLNILKPSLGKSLVKIDVDWRLWNEPVIFRELEKEKSKKEEIFTIPIWTFYGEQRLSKSHFAVYIWLLLVSCNGIVPKEKVIQRKMAMELDIKTNDTIRAALHKIVETKLLIKGEYGYKINNLDIEAINISRFSLVKILNYPSSDKADYFRFYLCLVLLGKKYFYNMPTFSCKKFLKDGLGISKNADEKVLKFFDDFKGSDFLKLSVAKKVSNMGIEYNEYQVDFCYDFIWNKI